VLLVEGCLARGIDAHTGWRITVRLELVAQLWRCETNVALRKIAKCALEAAGGRQDDGRID